MLEKSYSNNVKFTHSGKQRPLDTLIEEVRELISRNVGPTTTNNIMDNTDPLWLVGRPILHKFIDEHSREEEWYEGYILSYNAATKMHEVAYVEEEQHCFYDLMEDVNAGDLEILED